MWHIFLEIGIVNSGYRTILVGTRRTGTPSEEYRVLTPNTDIYYQKYNLKEVRVCQKIFRRLNAYVSQAKIRGLIYGEILASLKINSSGAV